MDLTLTLLIVVIVTALIFDFFNGFHDAANTIATIVVTRTMTPLAAVMMAGCANFIGFWFGTAVAKTVGKGIVSVDGIQKLNNSPEIVLYVLISALMGAVLWNILTWLLGLPTSSSHALIGGLIGAAIAAAGMSVVNWGHGDFNMLVTMIRAGDFKNLTMTFGVKTIFAFIFIAPMLGFAVAALFTWIVRFVCQKAHPKVADKAFKFLQVVAAIFGSIAHGTNDAQKSMGVIAMAMVAAHAYANSGLTMDNCIDQHRWIAFSCYLAISLGTMFGGWRIVRTMGTQITKIRPMEGFTSGSAAALAISGCSELGIPVSTTHVIAGSIMGVGAAQNAAKVRWITARKIVWAWFLTIPATATCAGFCFMVIKAVIG